MFKESEHPRDKDGKFIEGAGASSDRESEEIAKEIFPHLRGKEKSVQNNLTIAEENDTIKLPDIPIGRSLGAKAKNYEVLDFSSGKRYPLVEGTHLQDVEVFAGGRSKTPYRNAYKYAKIGGRAEDWEHVKAVAWLNTEEGPRRAEVHWSQCEGVGKHDFFIKEWLDES